MRFTRSFPAVLAITIPISCVAFADDAPPAAWPSVHFTLELVDALSRRDTVQWSAVPVGESETALRGHVTALIRSEVGTKYPCDFLRHDLLSVHVVHRLAGGGRAWGGLHWGHVVLVTTGPDDHIVAALHHEIAGLLLKRHPTAMSWRAWRQLSQPFGSVATEFAFLPEAAPGAAKPEQPLDSGTMEELADPLAELGHVSRYGLTTEANDLEEYIRLLFQRPGRMLECASRHGIVRAKLGIALDFLEAASEGAMSREFLAEWMAECGDSILAREPKLLSVLATGPPPE